MVVNFVRSDTRPDLLMKVYDVEIDHRVYRVSLLRGMVNGFNQRKLWTLLVTYPQHAGISDRASQLIKRRFLSHVPMVGRYTDNCQCGKDHLTLCECPDFSVQDN